MPSNAIDDANAFLAAAGALLERFDPETTLQGLVELAVPRLADWCFIHVHTPNGVKLAAVANTDPAALAAARARADEVTKNLSPDTALSRVLAGGPRELMQVDDEVLVRASRSPAHLAELRARGYRSSVVAPLNGRDGVLGAVTFAMGDSDRRYAAPDLELLAELSRRTGIALDNARLFAAEQAARKQAEEARDRTRRLQELTVSLSRAMEKDDVIGIMVDAGRDAIGAHAGHAWMLVNPQLLELVAQNEADAPSGVAGFRTIPLSAAMPVCDVIRSRQPMMFDDLAAMTRYYPAVAPPTQTASRAWAVIPIVVGARAIGAASFSFANERAFTQEDRDLLVAMIGQCSLALERCTLLDAERRARADAEAARQQLYAGLRSAKAATWQLDLRTMTTSRDPSYIELLGLSESTGLADYGDIHPDDREELRRRFELTLREGVPFDPEVRVRRGDGSYTWVRAHGRITDGLDGTPTLLSGVMVDIDEAKRASLRAEEERRISDTMHRLGSSFASELDHERLAQLIIEETMKLVGATCGAFFHAVGGRQAMGLHPIVAGDPRGAHELFARRLAVLVRDTLVGRQIVRIDDIAVDPRVGPEEVVDADTVRSYLALPVVAASGEMYGSVLFGHPEAGRFTEYHQRIAAGIAGQAATALDNARLYGTVRDQKNQLEIAVERAQTADRRKDEFLAMLGHELRNPLAPITTALELIELKGATAVQKEREVIRRQVEHMTRLVDDLLDVSRITRGKIALAREVVEIGPVLARAIEMASPLLEKRLQRLTVDVPASGLTVDADPMRLAQVFQNLLTNAAKYSEQGKHIALQARRDGNQVLVEIRDDGIGIPAELLTRLFDLFVQGERALDRSQGGLGIGLTLAKSLVELHGGMIEAASDGRDRGSTFRVRLPHCSRDATAPAVEARQRVGAAVLRVLLVDDNVDAAETLHQLLSQLGHETAVVHDAPSALLLASTFKPDVAVLDIGLPVMDGFELARKLREHFGSQTPKLIAVTGYGQEADRLRVREAGFDHHLVKPVAIDMLVPLIDTKN